MCIFKLTVFLVTANHKLATKVLENLLVLNWSLIQ